MNTNIITTLSLEVKNGCHLRSGFVL